MGRTVDGGHIGCGTCRESFGAGRHKLDHGSCHSTFVEWHTLEGLSSSTFIHSAFDEGPTPHLVLDILSTSFYAHSSPTACPVCLIPIVSLSSNFKQVSFPPHHFPAWCTEDKRQGFLAWYFCPFTPGFFMASVSSGYISFTTTPTGELPLVPCPFLDSAIPGSQKKMALVKNM